MNIIWKIASLERSLPDGTVLNAHWTAYATDAGFGSSAYGSVSFSRDPEAPGFIPYDELTEPTVIGWVKGALGAEQVAAVEARMAADIEAQRAPKTAAGVPWGA